MNLRSVTILLCLSILEVKNDSLFSDFEMYWMWWNIHFSLLQPLPGFVNWLNWIQLSRWSTQKVLFRNVLIRFDIRKHFLGCGSNLIHTCVCVYWQYITTPQGTGIFPLHASSLSCRYCTWSFDLGNSRLFPLKACFLYARFHLRQVCLYLIYVYMRYVIKINF